MMTQAELTAFRTFAELQKDMILGGAAYAVTNDDTVSWTTASRTFDLRLFNVGETVPELTCIEDALNEGAPQIQRVQRNIFGKRLTVQAIPYEDEEGYTAGTFVIVCPRLHSVATAFPAFAPILTEMFPEGAFIYMTDLDRIILRQPSSKFNLPSIVLGYTLKETDIAYKTVRSRKPSTFEVDASRYGVPVLVTNFPLYDDEDASELVGTLGIVVPKQTANLLKQMSSTLDGGLNEISASIEQLAHMAGDIYANGRDLNDNIKEIYHLSDEINSISRLLNEIANQTNLLGLNASIEAARAGNEGKGFGVVAEEIRKLSLQSKDAVPRIQEITSRIKGKVDETGQMSEKSLKSSEEQADTAQVITSNIQEMTSMAEELNALAQNS